MSMPLLAGFTPGLHGAAPDMCDVRHALRAQNRHHTLQMGHRGETSGRSGTTRAVAAPADRIHASAGPLRRQFGARLLSKRLAEHRIAHVYEEFDDTHSSIDYRMDASLPFLSRALRA